MGPQVASGNLNGSVYSVDVQSLFYTCMFIYIYVVVNFLFQVIFIFPLFLGMVIYANEFETKKK